MYIGRYNYDELRKAAIENPTEENLAALGKWFELYGMDFWNGQYFDADGYELWPVYAEAEEDAVQLEQVGWELR